jgi:hypothetical protein
MSTNISISKRIAIQDEGVLKTSNVNSINFTGAGITATNVGDDVTVNVPGSAGGGGVHILTKPVSGRTYNARRSGTNSGLTFNPAANIIVLYPFIPANTLTVSSFSISVSTGTASGLIRILVYSDSNGVPSSKLVESTSLDCSSPGFKTYNASFTFTAGTVYWLGYYANAVLNAISAIPSVELTPISSPTNVFTYANLHVTAAANFGSAPSTLGTATPTLTTGLFINLIAA